MPVYLLNEEIVFPPPEMANEDGILAIGGDLSTKRLLLAYQSGIFPWPHEDYPLLWFSPDPRFVIEPKSAHIPHSLKKNMRKAPYDLRMDTAFVDVIHNCALTSRPNQDSTWITPEMEKAYTALHHEGFAHSVEAYSGQELVGGLYGVSLGGTFFGESMFAKAPDASKICFAALIEQVTKWQFDLIDCQAHTEHLERFGATHWPREKFLEHLKKSLKKPTLRGRWQMS